MVLQYVNRDGQGIPVITVTNLVDGSTKSHKLSRDSRLLLTATGAHGETIHVYVGGHNGAPGLDESIRGEIQTKLRSA
jgi:hypothetical protein